MKAKGVEAALAAGQGIAVRLGPESKLVDLEADSKGAEQKIQSLFAGDIPPTPTYRSRRGLHRFFQWDKRLEKCNSSTVNVEGVEARIGANGKATASTLPPTTADDVQRKWLPGRAPWEVSPAKLPPAIVAKIVNAKSDKRVAPRATGKGGCIPIGSRNDFLTSVAGFLRSKGVDGKALLPALAAVNDAACSKPLPATEIAAIVQQAEKWEGPEEDAKSTPSLSHWPKPVDGSKLIAELERYVTRYVVLPEGALTYIVAWTMAAWAVDAFDRFPHLAITSPAKRCGKTRLLQVLEHVLPRPLNAASVSPAVVYHAVEKRGCTLLIDEAQQLARRDENCAALRELLCAGIDRNAKVLRMGGANRDEVQEFNVYGPKAVALIGDLDDVLADRCLPVRLERKESTMEVTPYRSRLVATEALPLARKLARWAADNRERLAEAYDAMTALPLKNDRMAELLLPLQSTLTLADRSKCRELERVSRVLDQGDVENEQPGIMLLAALREIVKEDFMETTAIIKALVKLPDAPWGHWNHGDRLSPHALMRLLRPFKVHPRKNRQGTARGYALDTLRPVWERYIPSPGKVSNPSKVSEVSKSKGRQRTTPRKPR